MRRSIDRIVEQLRTLGPDPVDPSPAIKTLHPFHGVSVADLRRVATRFVAEHAERGPPFLLAVCDGLWQRAVREEMVTATHILARIDDGRRIGIRRLDRWGALLDDWEATDNLGGAVGLWVAEAPGDRLGVPERLAGRRNPWLRRLALASAVYTARGEACADTYRRIEAMVLRLADDREASIPNAISWVLREATKHCADLVAATVDRHGDRLPAIARREVRTKLETGRKR